VVRKSKVGTCIHCLEQTEDITRDHIFPKAWYPDNTPEDQQRWTAPACQKCNKGLGKTEEKLLLRLGLCLDPKELASLGITNRMLRSISPEAGKNSKDIAARSMDRQRIIDEMIKFSDVPKEGLLPNFGPIEGYSYETYGAVLIGEDDLKIYAEKLVRGLSFYLDNALLANETKIELLVVDVKRAQWELGDTFERGEAIRQGDSIVVRRISTQRGKAIYHFVIWKRLEFYVTVNPPII